MPRRTVNCWVNAPVASVATPEPPKEQKASYSGAVRHSLSATNDDGWRCAPVTVTDWPRTRSLLGVTVMLGGVGSGMLSSKSRALFATSVVSPNDVLTSEHRPGASAQSTSP